MYSIRKKTSEKIFDAFNAVSMIFLAILFVYPLLYVIFASFSNPDLLLQHRGLLFWPRGFTTICYETISEHPLLLLSYRNTLLYVTLGTTLNMIFTVLAAYVVSRRDFIFAGAIMKLVVLTMFLSGGLIPTFLLVRDIGLYDSIWAIMILGLINPWNMILMRNAFMQIPSSLEDAARIDGAGHYMVLWNVVIPLSIPTLAVMVLFFAVGRWNSWFLEAVYFQNRELFPLQLIMREILIQNQMSEVVNTNDVESSQLAATIKYAAIVVATMPILCIYPFLQKYFVSGIIVGAVKG